MPTTVMAGSSRGSCSRLPRNTGSTEKIAMATMKCLGLLQWPTRHYFTGRSPTTTLSAILALAPYQAQIHGATDALGTEQAHDFANAIDWLPVPGGNNIADEHSGARKVHPDQGPRPQTPRPSPQDRDLFDAGSRFTGWRLTGASSAAATSAATATPPRGSAKGSPAPPCIGQAQRQGSGRLRSGS